LVAGAGGPNGEARAASGSLAGGHPRISFH